MVHVIIIVVAVVAAVKAVQETSQIRLRLNSNQQNLKSHCSLLWEQ